MRRLLTYSVIAVQLASLCLLIFGGLFGAVGFDHPGRYRLDVDKMFGIGFIYFSTLAAGFRISMSDKRHGLLILQIAAVPIVFVAAMVTSGLRTPPVLSSHGVPDDIRDLQYLIGKSSDDVRDALQHLGVGVSGFGGSTEWHSFERYGLYEVHYSNEGIVVSISDVK